ncbi:MAG: hypothetical protein AB1473_00580 [Thermodesulfobacteriota bacterium]
MKFEEAEPEEDDANEAGATEGAEAAALVAAWHMTDGGSPI